MREALCYGDLLEAQTIFPVRILHHPQYLWVSNLSTILGLIQDTTNYLSYL